jgi:hypothetical protein
MPVLALCKCSNLWVEFIVQCSNYYHPVPRSGSVPMEDRMRSTNLGTSVPAGP